jgi:hypothetical protein
MAYGLSFAAIASLVVYTYLHHGKTIWRQYKSSTTEKPDIHMKLMRRYKEAPTWWYMSLFAVVSPSSQCYIRYLLPYYHLCLFFLSLLTSTRRLS